MSPWFLRDPARLRSERAAIEELASRVDWLVGYAWKLDAGLCLDAVIRIHGDEREVRVSFPDLYPDAPCIVRPRNPDRRWTSHQYGSGIDGPLCLEWGSDNWHSDITVAMMLESTFRLLDGERPHEGDVLSLPSVVPSRHLLSAGQELRSKVSRWYAGRALRERLAKVSGNARGSFKYSLRKVGGDFVTLIHELTTEDGESWSDLSIPSSILGARDLLNGNWRRTQIAGSDMQGIRTLDQLRVALTRSEPEQSLDLEDATGASVSYLLLVDKDGELHLFYIYSGGIALDGPVLSGSEEHSLRAPDSAALNGKRVGIVGLGSAGSKLAVSLARMGLTGFYLVDHDVFLPENLSRNELDWQSVGRHKVNAVNTAITLVRPEAHVDTACTHLTGQESSAVVAGVLKQLAKCDLIVDATANPRVFNLLASVSKTSKHPMVWFEVFGGGFGGLVARSRPDVDPTPQDMRGVYWRYCEENPAPEALVQARDYQTEDDEGAVLEASDADVAIMATHAVRFVTDCLAPADRSRFPYSMYLVGFKKGWVFEQPFSTIPISMEEHNSMPWGVEDSEMTEDDARFLLGLFKDDDHAPNHTDENSEPAS